MHIAMAVYYLFASALAPAFIQEYLWGSATFGTWGTGAKQDMWWWTRQTRQLYSENVWKLGWSPRKRGSKEGDMCVTKFHSWKEAPALVIWPDTRHRRMQRKFLCSIILPLWFSMPHKLLKDKHTRFDVLETNLLHEGHLNVFVFLLNEKPSPNMSSGFIALPDHVWI